MLGMLLGGSVVSSLLAGPSANALIFFLPIAYVLYLVAATYETRRTATRVLGAVAGTVLLDAFLLVLMNNTQPYATNGGTLASAILAVLAVTIAWFIGYIIRQRRRYAIGLQEEAASKAVAEERLRIARELHDVVAHSMSVIAVQAGYGQYVIDSQPDDARAALGAIQTTSREALDEMRRMLGALRVAAREEATAATGQKATLDSPGAPYLPPAPARQPAGLDLSPTAVAAEYAAADGAEELGSADDSDGSFPRPADAFGALAALFRSAGTGSIPAAPSRADTAAAPLFPAPGLDDMDRLLSRTASAGVQVELHRRGEVRALPPSIDLSAYRIIQEALTNVVKHARASRCEVVIEYRPAELAIWVTDSGAGMTVPAMAVAVASRNALLDPLPGGHGIIGMRERVSLLGGEFSAGPLPGYGFEVMARIPLPTGTA